MTISNGDPEATHFLNVDLDIHSKSDLQPLVSALGEEVVSFTWDATNAPTAHTSSLRASLRTPIQPSAPSPA
jgi:hypothetical protein